LRNLRIDEVSSVDKGAGEGVRVVLMKRHGDVGKVWKSNADLPDGVKSSLPDQAQTVFRTVANGRLKAGQSEESAIKQAWSAVKNGWEKRGDRWVRKASHPWAHGVLVAGWEEAFDGSALTYCKREVSQDERENLASEGKAMAGGGYPIASEGDLKNAIRAIGRAKNPSAVKAHIKRRAAALGRSDLVPDTWKRAPIEGIPIDIGLLRKAIVKAQRNSEEVDMTHDELIEAIDAAVAKSIPVIVKKLKAHSGGDHKVQPQPDDDGDMDVDHVDDNPDDAPDPKHDVKGKVKFKPRSEQGGIDHAIGKSDDDDVDEARKALAIARLPASVRKVLDEADENAKQVRIWKREREVEDFKKHATSVGLKPEDGEILRKAFAGGDAAAQKVLMERIASLSKRAQGMGDTAIVFKEFGHQLGENGGNGGDGSAYGELMARAAELKKQKPDLSEAQAFAKVMTDPANRDLMVREKQERMAKIQRMPQP